MKRSERRILSLFIIPAFCLCASYAQGAELSDTNEGSKQADQDKVISHFDGSTASSDAPTPKEAPSSQASFEESSIEKESQRDSLRDKPPGAALPKFDTKQGARLWTILSNGMILSDVRASGKIVGSEGAKTMFGEGDTLYLLSNQDELSRQKEWAVFRSVKKVYHPVTGKHLGDLIQVVGAVKTLKVDRKIATAAVIHSSGPILRGDQIAPVENLLTSERPSAERSSSEMAGTIVEMKDQRMTSGQLDIVYIDRGKKDGVAGGDRFEIIQRGARISSQARLPERKIGSLIILSTQDQTSTAQIIESSEPISKGAPILSLPQSK